MTKTPIISVPHAPAPPPTVCLIGPAGPAVTSLTSILTDLGCGLQVAASPPEQATGVRPDLTLAEYRPREVTLVHFTALLCGLRGAPLIVVGPELPDQETAWLLTQGGARAYMGTGLSSAEKRNLILAHLPQVTSVALAVGRLQVDVARGQAWYGAQRLNLTATQFKLLCTLMQRPGQPLDCSSLELLAQCRGVPAHLSTLRRKLAAHSAEFLLRGTPQQGYVLDARRHARSLNAGLALKAHLSQLF